MKKTIKNIGLNASVAFAFMFATSLSVVAQEKVKTSESREKNSSSGLLQRLEADGKLRDELVTSKNIVKMVERALMATLSRS